MDIPGITHKSALPRRGIEHRQIRTWLRTGVIRGVGAWYVTPDAPADLVALLSHGVRPTCLDAAALHGLWTPLHPGVHAFRPRRAPSTRPDDPFLLPVRRRLDPATGRLLPPPDAETGRTRQPQPLVLHSPAPRTWPDDDPVPSLAVTLAHAARCLPAVKTAILIESALNQGQLSALDLADLLGALPQRLRVPLSRVRVDAQSGTETAVRWWLEGLRVTVRSQVQLLPAARVDLLVGTNWVIECDSRRFHDAPEQYREDRRRDLALIARGYTVTRLTWEQVFLEWEQTEQMLLTILHRRDHRRALPA